MLTTRETILKLKKKSVNLIPLPKGEKASKELGWTKKPINRKQFSNGYAGNIAFRHDDKTVCLDIDNIKRGMEIPVLGDIIRVGVATAESNWYTSGKENRAKGLYLLPPELADIMSCVTVKGVGQIRGGFGCYDVAPGSVLSDGRKYEWLNGTGPGKKLPYLPRDITKELLRIIRAKNDSSSSKVPGSSGYPHIDIYNKWFSGNLADEIISLGGYEPAGFNTLKRIGSENRHAVVIYNDSDGIDRCYNYSDTSGEGLLVLGPHDPYSVLSTRMGFDEARRYVCVDNPELKALVDTAIGESGCSPVVIEDNGAVVVDVSKSGYSNHTKYPKQVGRMERLVQGFLSMHHNPLPELAVAQAHTLISMLGGRVYTLPSGSGIVWTAIIVGRTGIGKSFLLTNIGQVISELSCGIFGGEEAMGAVTKRGMAKGKKSIEPGPLSTYTPLGATYYTSVKNIVKDVAGNGSILSVRTESGQSDRSKAGDMARVRMLELELSTKSGRSGIIAKGGQNDEVPAMFSPACTVVRETVLESTLAGDMEKNVDLAGDTGRRSHVVLNPLKQLREDDSVNTSLIVGGELSGSINELFSLACREVSRDATTRMPDDSWIEVEFASGVDSYYLKLKNSWIKIENQAYLDGDRGKVAFYSRLPEKVPAWAARLAIAESVDFPVISRDMIDCALESLLAEHSAFAIAKEDIVDDWSAICERIVNLLGKASSMKSFTKHNGNESRAKDLVGAATSCCVEWGKLRGQLNSFQPYKTLRGANGFQRQLDDRLLLYGVKRIPAGGGKKLWNIVGVMYQLINAD